MAALPKTLRKNIGKLMITKGVTDDGLLKLYQWDSVDRCTGEDCPAYSSCTMSKGSECGVQLMCIMSVLNMIFENYEEYLSEPLLYQIGMHILPMYKILSKLLVAEMNQDALYLNTKGNLTVNPVFKEIREQLKGISALWKNLGLPILAGEIKSNMPMLPMTTSSEEV